MIRAVLFLTFLVVGTGGCFPKRPPPPESAVISADSIHALDKLEKEAAHQSFDFPLAWQKGDWFSYDNPDEKWQVRERYSDRVVMVNDKGVLQILPPNPFIPAIAWQGPESKGRRKLSNLHGSLYPLAVGKRLQFDVDGQSDRPAHSWRAHWLCNVTAKKQARLPKSDQTTDAFVVVCESDGQFINFTYSPQLDHHLSIHTSLNGKDQVRRLTDIKKGKAN
ncbi:MAG: hypothetical protein HQL69_23460 [Magnetococcales bacterium]|nr:hypothetical protein [Magnetococcales bacterium]